MEVKWRNITTVLNEIQEPLDQVSRKGAEMIARDARRKVPVGKTKWVSAGRSGGSFANSHLRDQIAVTTSKFKNGGYIVTAQGAGNYDKFYASFVELGTHKEQHQPAQPYMRPAVKRNRPRIQKMWQRELDR